MNLHLCANQFEGRWEVLDSDNDIRFIGTLEECKKYISES